MSWVEVFGWLAASLTLLAYSMRTMLPLRCAAIGANICFIIFSWYANILPTLVLHLALLPFNSYRLWELLTGLKAVRAARSGSYDFSWLSKLVRPVTHPAGTTLFRVGDPPTYLYLIDEGEIRIDEVGVTLGPGDILGEIAFFTEGGTRTASATCVTEARVFPIDEARFLALYHQSPAFGLAVARLVTRRLLDNSAAQDS